MKDVMKVFAVVGAIAVGSAALSAQGGRPGRSGGPGAPGVERPDGGVTPAEVQRMFDVRKACGSIDQALDVEQQARFRVFEENMERRKLELVTRARQANRPKP